MARTRQRVIPPCRSVIDAVLKSPTADELEATRSKPLDPNGAKEPNRTGEGVPRKRRVRKIASGAKEPNRPDHEQDQPGEEAGLHNTGKINVAFK